ncbi:MAG: hypothetical protein PF436_12870 [Prolixibacteraceae bacterium]|jgi:hypothetical protein|nr:hypothetical protein [Prolixibacteraceae bacterium]
MSRYILLFILCVNIFLFGCKHSLENRIANEEYKSEILSVYDNKYINHFPDKIDSEPVSFGGRIKNAHTEHSVFFITKYPQRVVDTLYQYYQLNSAHQYKASQKNLLVVNRFTSENNWYKKKIASASEIKYYTQEVDYEDRLPIPNFWDRSYIIGETECNLNSDFELFVIEAKPGKYFTDSLLTQGTYMPKEWEHGFSRGIGISKGSRKVVYWFVYW